MLTGALTPTLVKIFATDSFGAERGSNLVQVAVNRPPVVVDSISQTWFCTVRLVATP